MVDAKSKAYDFDSLWNYNNPQETEVKFREIQSEVEKTQDLDLKLQLMTQIARTQSLQRKFVEAHKILDEVQPQLSPKTPIAEIRYFLERGRTFNSDNKKSEAIPLFTKAYELGQSRKNDNLAIDAAHMIGIAESTPEKQMEWNLKALNIAEHTKDPKAKKWLGSLYNNIAWTYHDMGKYQEALDLFKKGLAFRESAGEPTTIRIAKWSVARALRSLNQIDQALEIQLALEKELNSIRQKDGYVFEELGELYLLKKEKTQSKKYFAMAYEELSKDAWFKENEAKRLQRIKELSEN